MPLSFQTRVALLVIGLGTVTCLTIIGVQDSWRRAFELQHKLTSVHLESFRLADDFQHRLHDLNAAVFRFAARREPDTWREFEKASVNLDHWIDDYDPRSVHHTTLSTDRERELFKLLNDAYDDYVRAARQVATNRHGAMISAEAFAPLEEFGRHVNRLLDLGTQLADAHRVAQEAFLADANRSLSILRSVLMGSVAFMLIFVAGLAAVIYRDMIRPMRTRLVQHEAQLEKKEKLATLGTLAAGIAHEIRNPLTSLKARLYLLDKHLETPVLAREDASVINTEIGRLERIVHDVLQFARPSDPRMEIMSASILLTEVQALMSGALEREGGRLVIEPGQDLEVSMDPALIKQVLINLIRNASEASSRPGIVRLRLRKDRVRLGGTQRDAAVIEVIDEGAGIPPDVEKRLFDPFFTTKESGTGLGLSIAARIVEKHGGVLQYLTQVGHGTTFGIVLPLATGTKP